MMRASVNLRGRSTTIVHVRDVTDETDDQILDEALRVAGETRSSLFGWTIDRTLDVVVVALHTD